METLPRTKIPSQRKESYRRKIATADKQPGPRRPKIGPQHGVGFQPTIGHSEQWTVDPFWVPVRPSQNDRPGPSSEGITPSRNHNIPIPMEESEIDSETDRDPSVLGVPAKNLGTIRRSEKCTIREGGTRTTSCSRRKKLLESGAGSARVIERFLHRSNTADDRNYKRSNLAENSGVSGKTTARDDTRGVPNV